MLEPIVNLEVICPDAKTGDIAGDLSSRRGQVTGTKGLQAGVLAITGLAPLVELDGYSARLKSVDRRPGQLDDAVVPLRAGACEPSAATVGGVQEVAQARRGLDTLIGCVDQARGISRVHWTLRIDLADMESAERMRRRRRQRNDEPDKEPGGEPRRCGWEARPWEAFDGSGDGAISAAPIGVRGSGRRNAGMLALRAARRSVVAICARCAGRLQLRSWATPGSI